MRGARICLPQAGALRASPNPFPLNPQSQDLGVDAVLFNSLALTEEVMIAMS